MKGLLFGKAAVAVDAPYLRTFMRAPYEPGLIIDESELRGFQVTARDASTRLGARSVMCNGVVLAIRGPTANAMVQPYPGVMVEPVE